MRTSKDTAQLSGGMISNNVFTLLGTGAILGRTIGPADDADPDVVVLSFDTWQRLFHSDLAVVGTTIELRDPSNLLERQLLTVIGVLPTDFTFPTGSPVDFYTPLVNQDAARRFSSALLGRLGAGVPLDAATNEANLIGNAIAPSPRPDAPALTVPRFEVQVLKDRMVRQMRPALRILLAAVAVVLLLVCANVANLLLARGTARRREMALRFAIGARRGRIVRQVLAECLVLALVDGALGALAGAAGVALIKELAAVDAPGIFREVFGTSLLPRGHELGIDVKMFGIAFGIAAMTALAFGVLPALRLSRTDHLQAIGSRGGGSGRDESRLRAALVVGQLVMATVLLVGAGLLMHSFVKLSVVDNGYDPSNVLTFQLAHPAGYPISRKTDTIERLLARLRATPGVESAGFTRAGILIPEAITVGLFVPEGANADEMRADPARPQLRSVSHGYLTAMGVPVLDGREFEASDSATATPVIVISRTVARRYFGADRAVGRFVDWQVGEGARVQMQVVGVVEDVRNESPDREALSEIFIDYRQLLALRQRWARSPEEADRVAIGFLSFTIRTTGDPASAVPAVSQVVRALDPNVGISAMIPMARLVASSVARQRFYAVLLGVFAGFAGVLAAIGIYGVLAYAVMQRTQEIGIRMALGAQRGQILALVLRSGMILTAIGIALGLVGAAAATRLLQGLLFGITPLDPTTLTAVSLMFGLVAMLACYVPARRATKVEPV